MKVDNFSEADHEVQAPGHEPTCHGESPDAPGWCCMACCERGGPVHGHFACAPTPACGLRRGRSGAAHDAK